MKMKRFLAVLLASFLLAGCGTLMVGGQPAIGFESEKDKDGKTVPAFGTVITVHQYGVGGQVQPPPSPPGTPPTPPVVDPKTGVAVPVPSVSYQTVYRKVDDPTLRAFMNQSPNTVRLRIDDSKEEIKLAAYQSTADIAFKPGKHRVKVTVERPTANFGTLEAVGFVEFYVTPTGRWEVIPVGYNYYGYGY